MSEPQLISPLLDGFVMGDPINSHDGVRACPALQLETDKKYIVKIISLPASQAKLDALLLAGAFPDRDAALNYFKELADGVIEEAELLQKLARHEGFLSFENWQMLPMEDGETGFDIYLLSQYRPTLEGVLRANGLTHLQAINLGLDLCAALSVSRRFGYLYSNLRPSNIYLCNEREFRIGDLGFLSLASLPYASLPDKYRSDYTPPEISDAYSALNSTMDTYAVGLILYQAYNDGKLPPVGISPDAPCHADFALSEIILKACALDPAQRWQDPVQMGQALVNYLQSNTVNDTPIVPPVEDIPEETEAVPPDADTQPSTEDILAEVDQALEAAPAVIPSPVSEKEPEEAIPEENAADTPPEESISQASESAEADIPEVATAEDAEDMASDVTDPETCEETDTFPADPADAAAVEVQPDESDVTEDETDAQDVPQEEAELDETAQMLAQADDLIAHQLPDPPVAPDPIPVTLPVPEETEPEAVPEEATGEENTLQSDTDVPADDETPEESDDLPAEAENIPAESSKRRKSAAFIGILLAAILCITSAAVIFYQNIYLQNIERMVLTGSESGLTVKLTTNTADDLLSVRCTDTYGNSLTENVENGVAHFVGLKSGTVYKVEVRISGFHKLLGETTTTYTTATETVISSFLATTGPEDGSVILNFTPQGPTSAQWTVEYSTPGETTRAVTFNGHMVTLTGLTLGKEYTFTLKPVTSLYVSGMNTITYTASPIVYAQNLQIMGFVDGKLVIRWANPEELTVQKWYVRCYNDNGYDKTLSTTDTTIAFDGLDLSAGYTIEVTAEGMTLSARTFLTANSLTVKNLQADASDRNNLKVSWEFEGTAPEGGWLLLYTIDGSTDQQVIACDSNSGVITPLIPGANYTITVQAANGVTTFGNTLTYAAAKAPTFSGYLVKADNIEFSMCKTPSKQGWSRQDVPSSSYTTSFQTGVSASFVMHLDRRTNKSDDTVVTLYVIRNADGAFVSGKYESRSWDDMWYNRYGKLTIPVMPELPGNYTVEIYFNGTLATTQAFEVTSA